MLHDWAISEREYRRHEERRGRRHAFETIDAVTTSLVVVDMVAFFVDENPYVRGIVPNIEKLADSLRSGGGVVAWVVPHVGAPTATAEEFFGADIAARYAASGGDGSPRDRIASCLDVYPDDLVLEKTAPSAFFPGRSDLDTELRSRGVTTALVAGTVANVCCESTARDASTLGYRTVMVADANAAPRDAELNATLHTFYRSFGDVRTTDELIELLIKSG